MDVKAQLTKKLGPMPMWVWVALAAVAAGGFYYWKKKQAGTTTSSTAQNASSSTGSSQLPAGSGYAVVGQYEGTGVQGYNNPGPDPSTQGPGSTATPVPVLQPPQYVGPLSFTDAVATLQSGKPLFDLNPSSGMQPWKGTLAQLTAANNAGWNTKGNYPFYVIAQPQAGNVQVAPGLNSAPQPLNAVQTSNLNSGSPASAIAPSALQPA